MVFFQSKLELICRLADVVCTNAASVVGSHVIDRRLYFDYQLDSKP